MTEGGEAALRPARMPELDGIRGAAIASVLVRHYNVAHTVPGSLGAYVSRVFSFSSAGADMFFVLSGFLLGGILLDNQGAPRAISTFYVRRVCRLAPLYYVVFAVFAIVVASGVIDPRASAWEAWLFGNPMPLWSYVLNVQNILMGERSTHGANWLGVTWSLAVEVQFFILLPLLLLRRFKVDRLWVVLVILIVIAPVFRAFAYYVYPKSGFVGFVSMPGRLDALLFGVFGAVMLRHSPFHQWLMRSRSTLRFVAVACTVSLCGLIATGQDIASVGMTLWGHTALAILDLAVILLAVTADGTTRRVMTNPVLMWLGTISYGVFLFHQPISGLLHGALRERPPEIFTLNDAGVTLLALATTLLLAAASKRYLERPFITLGHRFRYW